MQFSHLQTALGSERAAALLQFCRQAVGVEPLSIDAASADASFRNYWRVQCGNQTRLLMNAPPGLEDVRPWVDINLRLCDAGLHAPAIYAADVEQGFLLIEDLGDVLYLNALDQDSVESLYSAATSAVAQLQQRGVCDGLPDYDEALLRTELGLFSHWFLGRHLGLALSAADDQRIELCVQRLVGSALEQPQVFVHRDFHSRNLLICEPSPGIIDFQDAVRGPMTYDYVSLLRDCYIAWEPAQVVDWIEALRERAVASGQVDVGRTRWRRWFDWMGVQRHLKVLGIFARLNYRDQKPGYLKDLPLVLHYVLSVAERYGELAPLADWLHRHCEGVDITRARADA